MPQTAPPNELRERDWTPDEQVLTVDAWVRIRNGAAKETVVEALSTELNRAHSAVAAAVTAVGATPAAGGNGAGTSEMLRALAAPLLANPRLLRQVSEQIRQLWSQRASR